MDGSLLDGMRLTRSAPIGAASQVDGPPSDSGEDQGHFRWLGQFAASPRLDNCLLDKVLGVRLNAGPLTGKE